MLAGGGLASTRSRYWARTDGLAAVNRSQARSLASEGVARTIGIDPGVCVLRIGTRLY
jgi:hypothetical protein